MTMINITNPISLDLEFPVYAVCIMDAGSLRLAVGGGGGTSNSGIKNGWKLFAVPLDRHANQDHLNVTLDSVTAILVLDETTLMVADGSRCTFWEQGSNHWKQTKLLVLDNAEYIRTVKIGKLDGQQMVFVCDDEKLCCLDRDRIVYRIFEPKFQEFRDFDVVGHLLVAVTSQQCFLHVVNSRSNRLVDRLDCAGGRCVSLGKRFSYGFCFVACNRDQHAIIFQYTVSNLQFESKQTVYLKIRGIVNSTVSNDGLYLAVASSDFSVFIYHTKTLQIFQKLVNHHGFSITCLQFSRDSEYIVTGSLDSRVKITPLRPISSYRRLTRILAILCAIVVASSFFSEFLY